MKILSYICLFAMLVGAFFSFVKNPFLKRDVVEHPEGYLEKCIPAEIGKMSGVDKPLGETEEVVRASEKILSVSQFLHREYTLSNGISFTLYISYWGKNKQTIHQASTHTPDRCWVKNGWTNDMSKLAEKVSLRALSESLRPASYREYTIEADSSQRRYVYFWFVVDGKVYDFKMSQNYMSNPFLLIKNAVSNAMKGSPEMFFVRIDSAFKFEHFKDNPDFKALLEKLGNMILFEKGGENEGK